MKVESYQISELTKLVGYTIEAVTANDQGWPVINVRKANPLAKTDGLEQPTFTRYWIHIQCDAEGNGPGWANVEKVE